MIFARILVYTSIRAVRKNVMKPSERQNEKRRILEFNSVGNSLKNTQPAPSAHVLCLLFDVNAYIPRCDVFVWEKRLMLSSIVYFCNHYS